MKIEDRTSKRGHPYRVYHGEAMAVSVFQTSGSIKVHWPFPSSNQQKKVFFRMKTAVTFAINTAEGIT